MIWIEDHMIWREWKWKEVVWTDEKLFGLMKSCFVYILKTIRLKGKSCLMNLLMLYLYLKYNKVAKR